MIQIRWQLSVHVPFRRRRWKEICRSRSSLAITATPTAPAPATTCWRLWSFPFSTPCSSCWDWSSTAWLRGCFCAFPPNRISSYTWRTLWWLTSSWPSLFPSRLVSEIYICVFSAAGICCPVKQIPSTSANHRICAHFVFKAAKKMISQLFFVFCVFAGVVRLQHGLHRAACVCVPSFLRALLPHHVHQHPLLRPDQHRPLPKDPQALPRDQFSPASPSQTPVRSHLDLSPASVLAQCDPDAKTAKVALLQMQRPENGRRTQVARGGQPRVPSHLLGEPGDRDRVLHPHHQGAVQILRTHSPARHRGAHRWGVVRHSNAKASAGQKENERQCLPGAGGVLRLLRPIPLCASAVYHEPDPGAALRLQAQALLLSAEREHTLPLVLELSPGPAHLLFPVQLLQNHFVQDAAAASWYLQLPGQQGVRYGHGLHPAARLCLYVNLQNLTPSVWVCPSFLPIGKVFPCLCGSKPALEVNTVCLLICEKDALEHQWMWYCPL